MKAYEGLLIYPPESAAETRKSQDKNFEDLVKKFQGKIIQKTECGKKPLGYPLKKFREGFFVVTDFEVEPGKMTDFRKALELQEDLLKFMLTVKNIKAEQKTPSKAPSSAPSGTQAHPAGVPRS